MIRQFKFSVVVVGLRHTQRVSRCISPSKTPRTKMATGSTCRKASRTLTGSACEAQAGRLGEKLRSQARRGVALGRAPVLGASSAALPPESPEITRNPEIERSRRWAVCTSHEKLRRCRTKRKSQSTWGMSRISSEVPKSCDFFLSASHRLEMSST